MIGLVGGLLLASMAFYLVTPMVYLSAVDLVSKMHDVNHGLWLFYASALRYQTAPLG